MPMLLQRQVYWPVLPVDTFPKQVRVTVVPGVLLDHVDQQLT